MKFRPTLLLLTATGLVSGFGCSSSNSDGNVKTNLEGGAVVGALDDHCGDQVGVSDPAACSLRPGPEGEGGASGDEPTGAAGATDCNQTHGAAYGDTLYNSAGKDDDCKYRVSWTSTPIRKGEAVTFTVTTSNLETGEPLEGIGSLTKSAGALTRVEPYIPCESTHFAPPADFSAPITETLPGVYEVGPIVFDKSARWALRLHFYEACFDTETSPHGHVAFFIDVP